MAALELRVVPVAEIDPDETVALINEAFALHKVLGAPRTSLEELPDEAGDDGEFLHARDGGALIASALIRDYGRYTGDQSQADALYLGLVAVKPREARHGLGRQLVAAAERVAAERGYRRVVLSTLREFGLVGYYEAQGYTVTNTTEFEAGHWSVTVPHLFVEMEKRLGTAQEAD